MNNQTIDGVPRDLLERVRRQLDEGKSSIASLAELRALLDKPVGFTTPDCPDCACVQDGHCLCIPSKPAAQHQGEPVAWLLTGSEVWADKVVEVERQADKVIAEREDGTRKVALYAKQPLGEPIYQVMYRGDGGGGWCDAEKDSYDLKVLHPKHWRTRIVYAAQPLSVLPSGQSGDPSL